MANFMFGFPNRADQSTLSGGAWQSSLPRSLLQDRTIGRVAQTLDTALASTQFNIDLGAAKKTQLLSLRNHNFSLQAKYRITGASDAAYTTLVYDSTWLDVWPTVYPYGTLEWEDDNWWSGKYTLEESIGYVPELVHIIDTPKLPRYWRVEIDDTANPAGFVQIGRLFIGPAWQPQVNMSYQGSNLGWETKTETQETLSGAEYFQRRTPYRVQHIKLDMLSQSEAFSQAFELMRRAGVDQEILFIHDPQDTVHALRRRFLARLRQLNAIEYPYGSVNGTAFEVKELL